jgi:hypothetical protein
MKLRIKGNSIRFRVSRSEVECLLQTGRIEETIHFGQDKDAKLTYALEHALSLHEISLRYQAGEVTIVLSSQALQRWADAQEQVGVYGRAEVSEGELIMLVEKDFACLDGTEAENEDTFPNPDHGTIC